MEEINCLRVVLVEKKKTGKWLAEKLDKDPATVSCWCSNAVQPSIETFVLIAELLKMELRDLYHKMKV